MKIRYNIAQGSYQLSRLAIDLSKEAQVRLSWFDYYQNHQHNARLTCRHFRISPQTFYRWQKRYDLHHRKILEPVSAVQRECANQPVLWHKLKPYVRYRNDIPTGAKTNWR